MSEPLETKPVWISHRGYKEQAAENTFEAFQAAVDHGFMTLETDLRACADGSIVLAHDRSLQRLAGDPRRVEDLRRRDLETVRFYDGSRFFFLDDFLEAFAGCSWTFDIKPEGGLRTIDLFHAIAMDRGIVDWLMAQAKFVFWDRSQEERFVSLFPKARCYARQRECWRAGLAVMCKTPALGAIKPSRTYALPPRLGSRNLFRTEMVTPFHKRGARVIAYLPETDEDARDAVRAGFDELLTNGLIVSA